MSDDLLPQRERAFELLETIVSYGPYHRDIRACNFCGFAAGVGQGHLEDCPWKEARDFLRDVQVQTGA